MLATERPSSCDLASYLDSAERPTPKEVKVLTFWTDPAEALALDVLGDRVGELGPAFSETPRDDRADQQNSLRDWLTNDDSPVPDSYQVNGGSDVLQWVFADAGRDSDICPLDRVAESYDMFGRYFRAALAPVSCRGQLFAVPIGIHRLNVVFYHPGALASAYERASELGVTLPPFDALESPAELIDFLEVVASLELTGPSGRPLVPLSIGNQGAWPLTILAFDNMLAASPGREYEAIWMGRPAGETDAELEPGLEQLGRDLVRLAPLTNLAEHLSWQDATLAVGRGDALLQVMGDWALSQLSAEERLGVELAPFPGTKDAFVYTPDSFAVPRRGGDDGAGAHLWLHGVLDHHDTQLRFARAKQAIPAVTNLDESDLASLESDYLVASYRSFSACQTEDTPCRLLLAVSGLAPAAGADPCFDEVGLLLSRITGIPSQEELDGDIPAEDRACDTPLPATPDEAVEQLVDLLLEVSRTRYAAECRD